MAQLPSNFIKIIFDPTGLEFMEEDRSTHVFERQEDADKYLESHPECISVVHRDSGEKTYFRHLHKYGFKTLTVHRKDNPNPATLDIVVKVPIAANTNPDFYAFAIRYWESADQNLLSELPALRFVLPAYIRKKDLKKPKREDDKVNRPVILYAIAKGEDDNDQVPAYYVVFTDADALSEWKSNDNWSPMSVDYTELLEICGESGVMINPRSKFPIFLSNKKLRNEPEEEPAREPDKEEAELDKSKMTSPVAKTPVKTKTETPVKTPAKTPTKTPAKTPSSLTSGTPTKPGAVSPLARDGVEVVIQ